MNTLCIDCGDELSPPRVRSVFKCMKCSAPPPIEALSADDVRAARLDTDAHGRIFPEVERAAMLQVLRDIRDNQPTASAPVRGLAAAIIEKLGE